MKSPLQKKCFENQKYSKTQFIGISFQARDVDVEYFRPIGNVHEEK